MSHKKDVRKYCTGYLQSVNVPYDDKEFERIYRTGGSQANPFSFGIDTAEVIIRNSKRNQ